MDFVNRDFRAAVNMRRCAVQSTRPDELTRSNFLGQPLRLGVYVEKLKSIAGGRSNKAGRRLDTDTTTHTHVYIHIRSVIIERFRGIGYPCIAGRR
jgi:hypothetical protein